MLRDVLCRRRSEEERHSVAPESSVGTQQDPAQIVRVLEGVSRRTCKIYLAHRAGHSYEEIAALTGLSHRRIKRHIARGLLAIMEDRPSGSAA